MSGKCKCQRNERKRTVNGVVVSSGKMCQYCIERDKKLEQEKSELEAKLKQIEKEKANLAQQLEANKTKADAEIKKLEEPKVQVSNPEPKAAFVKPATTPNVRAPKPMNTEPKTVTPKQSVTRSLDDGTAFGEE